MSKAFSAPIDIKTAKEESEWLNFVAWWLENKISEKDFVKKTLYMVKKEIIQIWYELLIYICYELFITDNFESW